MAKSSCPLNCDDISTFAKNFKPPPPPGEKNNWELQFCRWWGWNWIQKTEMKQKMDFDIVKVPSKDQNIKVKQHEPRKVQKSHFKDLCQCLCFKKRPSNTPDPKKMYGTPSNSEICLCGTVTCGVIDKEDQSESIRTFEAQRKTSKNKGRKSCNPKCSEQSIIQIRRDFSDTDSYKCCSDHYRTSSTEESVRYLKVVCNCNKRDNSNAVPVKPKTECQTQTNKSEKHVAQAQTSNFPIRICGTQTVSKKDHKKKRHVTVVCCHCCKCECNCQKTHEKDSDLKQKTIRSSPSVSKTCNAIKNNTKTVPVFEYNREIRFPEFKSISNKNSNLVTKPKTWNKSLNRYRPWDTIFSNKELLTNFVAPYTKYPRIKAAKSDILDQRYRHRINEEFASPVSGKIYKLSTFNVTNLNREEPSNLPDPIEVSEYLRKLEEQLKLNLTSRAMLDNICDAILFSHNNNTKHTFLDDLGEMLPSSKSIQTCSSTFLHTFSYPCYDKPHRNVGLVNDKSTQSVAYEKFDFSKSIFSSDVYTQSVPSQNKNYFIDSLLPFQNEFNKSESSLSHEEPFQVNMNLFAFSRSPHSKQIKRSAPCLCDRPIKRFKGSTAIESTGVIVRNMEDMLKKMNEIIHMDESKDKHMMSGQVCRKQIETEKGIVQISRISKGLDIEEPRIFEMEEETRNFAINNKIDPVTLESCNRNDASFSTSVDGDVKNSRSATKFDESLSSSSSLFSKIDEIINRSQETENQIQKVVLHLPPKQIETKRDYANVDLEKYMSPRNSDISNGLTTILESSDEKSEENYIVK